MLKSKTRPQFHPGVAYGYSTRLGGKPSTARPSRLEMCPLFFRALLMELLDRYSGLKQRMIAERFGGLEEGWVSWDRRAIRGKIETEPKIRKWFQDLNARLSTKSGSDPIS